MNTTNHSLILQEADSPGMDHVAFKVEKLADLEVFERKIEIFGCTTKRISNGTRLGEGEAIRCELPTGHQLELYHEIERVGTRTGTLNPHPWPDGLRGIAPHRLDHVALTGDDVKSVTRFFTEVLDMFISEKITTIDGQDMVGSFMYARNGKAHDIAFIKGPDKKLHHAAFYVDNWYDVLKAADILTLPDVVADNASSSRVVLGSHLIKPENLDVELDLIGATLSINGEIKALGVGAAVLGHPVRSVAMLANMLARKGEKLKAGQVILTGGITEAVLLNKGDYVLAKLDGIGQVSFLLTRLLTLATNQALQHRWRY
jgi:hypothetical protein